MLFKKYSELAGFPKKDWTKITPPLTNLSSFADLNLCIILKIYLNIHFMNYLLIFR